MHEIPRSCDWSSQTLSQCQYHNSGPRWYIHLLSDQLTSARLSPTLSLTLPPCLFPKTNSGRIVKRIILTTQWLCNTTSLGGVFDGFRRVNQRGLQLGDGELVFLPLRLSRYNDNQSETRQKLLIYNSSYHSDVPRHVSVAMVPIDSLLAALCYHLLRYAPARKQKWAAMAFVCFLERLALEKRCCWNVFKISFVPGRMFRART